MASRRARAAAGRRLAAAENAAQVDAAVTYMETTNELFKQTLVDKCGDILKDLRTIGNIATADDAEPPEKVETMAKTVVKVQTAVFEMRNQMTRMSKRLNTQVQRVSHKLAKKAIASPKAKVSEARRAASVKKVASLTEWHSDVRTACGLLRAQGYKGSMKLKKNGCLYKKAQELRRQRFLATLPDDSGHAEAVAMNVDAIQDAPAELRKRAKSGDASVHVVG